MFGLIAHQTIPDLRCSVVVFQKVSLVELGAHRLHLRPHPLVLLHPERRCFLCAGRMTAHEVTIFLGFTVEAETALDAFQSIYKSLIGTRKSYLVFKEFSLEFFEVRPDEFRLLVLRGCGLSPSCFGSCLDARQLPSVRVVVVLLFVEPSERDGLHVRSPHFNIFANYIYAVSISIVIAYIGSPLPQNIIASKTQFPEHWGRLPHKVS